MLSIRTGIRYPYPLSAFRFPEGPHPAEPTTAAIHSSTTTWFISRLWQTIAWHAVVMMAAPPPSSLGTTTIRAGTNNTDHDNNTQAESVPGILTNPAGSPLVEAAKPESDGDSSPGETSSSLEPDPPEASTRGMGKWQRFWEIISWTPPPARYDAAHPPKFTVWTNLLFAFVGFPPLYHPSRLII